FDFFDEPDEETVTQRRSAVGPRRGAKGPRGPVRPPAGLTPILRLVGLIALAILVVVLLVFWIQGCQNDAKANAYRNYLAHASRVAKSSQEIGVSLKNLVVTPGIKQNELETRLNGLAGQERQNVVTAQGFDPPGHLRTANQHLIEALQLRVSGLNGLADAFRTTAASKDSDKAGAVLANQARRGPARDRGGGRFFRTPARES